MPNISINTMTEPEVPEVQEVLGKETFDRFEIMGLKEDLLRGIFAYGFETPSRIQQTAIYPIIKGKDIIAQSQSGTGKTGAFTISALQVVNEAINGCQVLIVAPTRELAQQIYNVCGYLGQYLKVKPILCVGGSNVQDARKDLDQGPSIVVGTPGRIIDMIERNFLSTRYLQLLILDEADEMLSKSFKDQIRSIIERIPKTSQICLFSATMRRDVLDLSKKFMNNPLQILVKTEELTLEGIKQFYIDVDQEKFKLETFCDLYDMISVNQSIIYVNTRRKAEWVRDKLAMNNFTVSIIHSDMSSIERTDIMKQFRSGTTRILISTDLLSRGIDVQQVSMVVNYDLPNDKECYLHRIGRSGRFGRKGVAINFVTNQDFWKIDELQQFYSTQIGPLPSNFSEVI